MRRRSGVPGESDWADEPEIRLRNDEASQPGWHVEAPPRSGGPTPPPRRWLAAGVLALVLLLAAASAVQRRTSSHPAEPAPPVATPTLGPEPTLAPKPPRGASESIPITAALALPAGASPGAAPAFNAIDVALSAGSIFILSAGRPAELVRTKPDGAQQAVASVPNGSTALAVDGSTIWVLVTSDSEHPATSQLKRYDTKSLDPIGSTVVVPGGVSGLAAGNGTVWLASSSGLFYVRGGGVAVPVGGVLQPVQALSLDLYRHRLIAALPGLVGTALVSVDPATAMVTGAGQLPLVDVSIAATAHSVWYAGFGDPGGYGGIGEFLPDSLNPGPDRADQLSIGPGARVWPGQEVVWVNSSGSGLSSCVSDTSGAALATWSELTGPFASVTGLRSSIGSGSARLLTSTGGCFG